MTRSIIVIIMVVVLSLQSYAQVRIISENTNDRSYTVNCEVEIINYLDIVRNDMSPRNKLNFNNILFKSQSNSEIRGIDFFIELPPNSKPKITYSVKKTLNLSNKSLKLISKILNNNTSSSIEFGSTFNLLGYFWSDKKYIAHFRINPLIKKKNSIIKLFQFNIEFDFRNQIYPKKK